MKSRYRLNRDGSSSLVECGPAHYQQHLARIRVFLAARPAAASIPRLTCADLVQRLRDLDMDEGFISALLIRLSDEAPISTRGARA